MPQVEITYSGLILQAIGQRCERRALLSYALVAVDGTAMRDLAAPLHEDGSVVRILVMSPIMIGG